MGLWNEKYQLGQELFAHWNIIFRNKFSIGLNQSNWEKIMKNFILNSLFAPSRISSLVSLAVFILRPAYFSRALSIITDLLLTNNGIMESNERSEPWYWPQIWPFEDVQEIKNKVMFVYIHDTSYCG
jgi:hypothetical protein